jgi:hypothetical protein
VHALNPNIKFKKRFITYIKHIYDVTTLKKHVDCEHAIIVKKIEEEVNKGPFANNQLKKIILGSAISFFSY